MSFNSNLGRMEYIVSSPALEYTYNFQIFNIEDLAVYLIPFGEAVDDTTQKLTLHTDYTVIIKNIHLVMRINNR